MLGLLIGCGLRRTELVELDVDQIQQREQHWVIVDLIGKGGRVRTVPIPGWVKEAVDDWVCSAEITEGRLFRAIRKNGVLWGCGLTQNVVWYVVKQCARRAGIQKLSPHDLRRSCARLCHESGGELEQIQFLLGHASVLTTERYIGCKQQLSRAVNDRIVLCAVNGSHRDLPEPTGQENGVVSGDIGEGSEEGKASRDVTQAPSGMARDDALVDADRVLNRAIPSPLTRRRIPRRPTTSTRTSEPTVSQRSDGS